MSYSKNNAPFVDDGIYEDDDGDDGSYEPDPEEKSKKKQTRKSTKGRKLKRWDGELDKEMWRYPPLRITDANNPSSRRRPEAAALHRLRVHREGCGLAMGLDRCNHGAPQRRKR